MNPNDEVAAGAPLFRLDSSEQEAALDAARRRIDEIDAEMAVAQHRARGGGRPDPAGAGLAQSGRSTNSRPRPSLQRRHSGTVAVREIERLQRSVDGLQGAVAARSPTGRRSMRASTTLLPAQKASAEAALRQAQAETGQDDRLCQHRRESSAIRAAARRSRQSDAAAGRHPRSRAGIRWPCMAGFNQIEADVLKVGMLGEVTCAAKPFTSFPWSLRLSRTSSPPVRFERRISWSTSRRCRNRERSPPTCCPLFGRVRRHPARSHCIANAYTSNHDRL